MKKLLDYAPLLFLVLAIGFIGGAETAAEGRGGLPMILAGFCLALSAIFLIRKDFDENYRNDDKEDEDE